MNAGFELPWDCSGLSLPANIAIEGPIGIGKSTLAKNLAYSFNHRAVLEDSANNPFIERFYQDPKSVALQTQLYFLFERIKQSKNLQQDDLFAEPVVSDFLIDKDLLFAQVVLDDDELSIYQQIYQHLTFNLPRPDLVVVLQASSEALADQVRKRGLHQGQNISPEYIQRLNEAYTQFFHHYQRAPVLLVNVTDIDLHNNVEHYKDFVEFMLTVKSGRHYYNPNPLL